jgi:hypothetical protein
VARFDSIRFQPSRPLLKEVSADRLNAILSEIKKNRPRGERGITVRQAGDATYIGLAAALPRGGTFTPTALQPWDLIARVDPDADPEDETPPYIIRVRPGTLNGILPTNWDEEFECVGGDGLHYAKAIVTTDGEAITGVTIAIDTTAPTVQEPQEFGIAAEVEYLFGLFAEGSVYRVVGAGHIALPTRTWLVTSADPAASPGQSPYDIYYVLGP